MYIDNIDEPESIVTCQNFDRVFVWVAYLMAKFWTWWPVCGFEHNR